MPSEISGKTLPTFRLLRSVSCYISVLTTLMLFNKSVLPMKVRYRMTSLVLFPLY